MLSCTHITNLYLYCILDLNLLHWGNTGSVAVALGYSLYILQPMSLHTTLLSTSSDGSFPSAVQWDPSGHSLAVGTSRGTVQVRGDWYCYMNHHLCP